MTRDGSIFVDWSTVIGRLKAAAVEAFDEVDAVERALDGHLALGTKASMLDSIRMGSAYCNGKRDALVAALAIVLDVDRAVAAEQLEALRS